MEKTLEREYIIPLRAKWLKAVKHKRAKKAVRAIREFLAKHMKAEMQNIKIGKWLNNELWRRGIKKPAAKIKIKAVKDEKGIVRAELSELPEFAKKIEAKLKSKEEKLKSKKKEEKKEEGQDQRAQVQSEKKTEEVKEEAKKEETKEKETEEKIMHKEVKPEETSHAPKDVHMQEKKKPFRTALKK